MAQIHNAFNELKEKVRKQQEERQGVYVSPLESTTETIFGVLITVVLCVGFLIFMFKVPQFGTTIRDFLNELAQLVKHPLIPLEIPHISFFRGLLKQPELLTILAAVLDFLLNVVVLITILVVDVGVQVITTLTPTLVWLALYIVPVLFIIFAVLELFDSSNYSGYSFGYHSASDEEQIHLNGLEGEWEALREMQVLPDDCHVYTNLHLSPEWGGSEMDIVVVSPVGITIVEVKNHKGIIQGSADDQQWEQVKSNGNNKELRNPTKQVSKHVYNLKNYLRSEGVNTYIQTCVFFVNKDARVQVNGLSEKCPVFERRRVDDLRRCMTTGRNPLPSHVYDKAIAALNKVVTESYEKHSANPISDYL